MQAARAYHAAHVAVLVIDAHHALSDKLGLTRREVALSSRVISEGRPIIVAINKLDTLPEAARSDVRLSDSMLICEPACRLCCFCCVSSLRSKGPCLYCMAQSA